MAAKDFWRGLPGDNEYLSKDIPLRDSIGVEGGFTSGYAHFQKYGRTEGRKYKMWMNIFSLKIGVPLLIGLVVLYRSGVLKKLFSKRR